MFLSELGSALISKMIEAFVELVAPHMLDTFQRRARFACTNCGAKTLTRYAPWPMQLLFWLSVMAFALGMTAVLLAGLALLIFVLAAIKTWELVFDDGFWTFAQVFGGGAVAMFAGAFGVGWYRTLPPKACSCGMRWPRDFVPPPPAPEVPVPRVRSPRGVKLAYVAVLLAGIGGAYHIYINLFNDLSSDKLVNLTPVWVLPIAFGLHGLLALRVRRHVAEGVDDVAVAAMMSVAKLSVVGLLAIPALQVMRWRQSTLAVASVGTALWALLLWLFLVVVFPSL